MSSHALRGGDRGCNTRTKAWVGTGQRRGEALLPFLPVCRGSTHLISTCGVEYMPL